MEDYPYIGWIPCINGHLDFGLMRVGIQGGFTNSNSKDINAINANFSCVQNSDSHARRIVLQSKVDWRDSDKFEKDSGEFRVIVTAEVNESNSMDDRFLSGNLLIYPLSAEPKDVSARHKMNIHSLCHSIKSNEAKRHENFNHLNNITSGKEPVDNLKHFSCSIGFKVEPNGITTLRYNPNNPALGKDSKYLIARQTFYYLKYAIHTHKHHTAKQDSLTTITPIYDDTEEGKTDAGLRLVCQLKRELTFIQRIQNTDGREHPTNNAAGIISYTQSLIQSLKQSLIINPAIADREQERFKHIRASFAAQNCKMDNQLSNSELIKSKAKVWLGFILASLWGTLNFVFKLDGASKAEIPSSSFYTGVVVILATLFLIYAAIKRYYSARQIPEASEHLYNITYYKLAAKILIPISLIILFVTLMLL
jgi:uncharacterized membrane protein YidH (DUF202 family)